VLKYMKINFPVLLRTEFKFVLDRQQYEGGNSERKGGEAILTSTLSTEANDLSQSASWRFTHSE